MEASDEIKWGSGKMSTQSMKTIVQQLIDLHVRLSQLAAEKTEAIKAGDVSAVDKLTKQEIPLVEKLQETERLRSEETARLSSGDLRADGTFRTWIARFVPEDARMEWDNLYKQLKDAVYTLKKANQLNQEMLAQSLQFVRLNLNLLQPQPLQPAGYGHRGGKQPSAFSRRIDSRA